MTNNNTNYISNQVQRTLRVIRLMAGNEISGISPTELSNLAKISASDVTRVLANLEAQQFVERLPADNKRYRLATALVQISNTVALNFAQAQQQLQQDQHNYSRLAV
jgi:DNA-binding IclR family transcriptional regulator